MKNSILFNYYIDCTDDDFLFLNYDNIDDEFIKKKEKELFDGKIDKYKISRFANSVISHVEKIHYHQMIDIMHYGMLIGMEMEKTCNDYDEKYNQ